VGEFGLNLREGHDLGDVWKKPYDGSSHRSSIPFAGCVTTGEKLFSGVNGLKKLVKSTCVPRPRIAFEYIDKGLGDLVRGPLTLGRDDLSQSHLHLGIIGIDTRAIREGWVLVVLKGVVRENEIGRCKFKTEPICVTDRPEG
jgi:hypothetical protein